MAIVENAQASTAFNAADCAVETYRGSGPGGQHRNTSDTGVRVRHIPTGLVTKSDRNRSWEQNYKAAMAEMERRLHAAQVAASAEATNTDRVGQIGSGDRASTDWTWCEWRNTVSEHRSGIKAPMDKALRGRFDW